MRVAITLLLLFLAVTAYADETVRDWIVRFQSTYIWQQKDAFDAKYSGPNSLTTEREKSYSFTATAFFGVRPWEGGELYFNPEVAQGVPLSNLVGLGGFTNGEMARTSGATLKLYRARLYLRQTWNLGGESQSVESGANQLPVTMSSNRFTVSIGNLSLLDVMDSNRYSHDPRTQFMNWALVTYGAYDFAADARGYTWGVIGEWVENAWTVRVARALLPQEPNQLALDTRIFKHFGDQLEIVREYQWRDQPGALHVLGFHDRAVMARYEDALILANASHATPDINDVRMHEQNKIGIGLGLEQALGKSVGVFTRAMWADGETETEAYATIDRSLATGMIVQGGPWHRHDDTLGLACAWNALSSVDRTYLAAGGLGFFIGDGQLKYGVERIAEVFYNFAAFTHGWLSLEWQHIDNPAYNRDRGPATFAGVRLHAEF